MPLNDLLLYIDSYPEPTSAEAIDQAVQFTAAVGGTLSALAVKIHVRASTNWLAEHLVHLSDMVAQEESKSAAACEDALAQFTATAKAAGVHGQSNQGAANLYFVGEYVAQQARTRDLCLVAIGKPLDHVRGIAEAVVFASGRPTLLFQPGLASLPGKAFGSVVLAWDGSRCAARAMADALPPF